MSGILIAVTIVLYSLQDFCRIFSLQWHWSICRRDANPFRGCLFAIRHLGCWAAPDRLRYWPVKNITAGEAYWDDGTGRFKPRAAHIGYDKVGQDTLLAGHWFQGNPIRFIVREDVDKYTGYGENPFLSIWSYCSANIIEWRHHRTPIHGHGYDADSRTKDVRDLKMRHCSQSRWLQDNSDGWAFKSGIGKANGKFIPPISEEIDADPVPGWLILISWPCRYRQHKTAWVLGIDQR